MNPVLTFANMERMKTIATEIRNFLELTGFTQRRLSLESGVPASTICNLLKGKRQNLLGPNQDNIRAAMSRLADFTLNASCPPKGDHNTLDVKDIHLDKKRWPNGRQND